MTDAAQAVVWAARYEPFGAVSSITGAAALNARFPGQWFQIEDGLAYNWHRTYDPMAGRYTQPDPLGFVDGPSVYGYAGQSPLMSEDPIGLAAVTGPTSKPPNKAQQCSRSDNMSMCLPLYTMCVGGNGNRRLLRGGKRCGDCFDICILDGYWPFQYCSTALTP